MFDSLGIVPLFSEGKARMIGFSGMFSDRARFGEGETTQYWAHVDHLLPHPPPDIASLLPDPAGGGLRRGGSKTDDIKTLRTVDYTGPKDSKEMVERIQAALPSTRD